MSDKILKYCSCDQPITAWLKADGYTTVFQHGEEQTEAELTTQLDADQFVWGWLRGLHETGGVDVHNANYGASIGEAREPMQYRFPHVPNEE